jgi:hypothetical protein
MRVRRIINKRLRYRRRRTEEGLKGKYSHAQFSEERERPVAK